MEPSRASDFTELEYWDNFFKIRDGKPFEWYGEFADFAELLAKHCGLQAPATGPSRILIPGCGNSELSASLYDLGFKQIVNIDFSKKVISEMLRKHMRLRPEMKWRAMDMTETKFSDASFDLIIDKGGLDALLGDPGQKTTQATNFLLEVKRLLVNGGKYVCISLGQYHVIEVLLFTLRHGWATCVYQVPELSTSSESKLMPFFVISTKSLHSSCSLVEVSVNVTEELLVDSDAQILSLQKAVNRENMIRTMILESKEHASSEENNFEDILPSQRVPRLLASQGFSRTTYSCMVLDAPEDVEHFKYKCAVFLVPKARRNSWLFSSEEGQWQVVESAQARRLIMVFLETDFYPGSMEVIQSDLSPLVQDLLPNDCKAGVSVPYLMCSDGILKREILEEVESSLTGAILVENVVLKDDNMDASNDQRHFRRLVFKRNLNTIQSEARLIEASSRSRRKIRANLKGTKPFQKQTCEDGVSLNNKELQVDHTFLASPYHAAMVAGLSLIAPSLANWNSSHNLMKVVIVGLGAGLLPMFLHKHFPFGKIEVMELDPIIGDLAKRYFGFIEDNRMKLLIKDGLSVVDGKAIRDVNCDVSLDSSNQRTAKSLKEKSESDALHVLIIDADSEDPSSGMTCPPAEFLDLAFLSAAKERLSEDGMLVINLVARAKAPHVYIPEKLKTVFAEVYSLEVGEDVNRVLFALPRSTGIEGQTDILELACKLKQLASDFAPWGSGPDIEEFAGKLLRC